MSKHIVHTPLAPAAIGTYSQAIRHGNTIYISGQIPLDPQSMDLVPGGIQEQVHQVFKNLQAVCKAAGGNLDDIVKLGVFLTDMGDFPHVNTIMANYFSDPYPARAAVGVAALPKGAMVEMDATLGL